MAPLTIDVTGESTISRVAERGVLTIHVSSTGKSQESVSEDVTRTCHNLRKTFSGLAPKNAEGLAPADAPVTQFSMSAFITRSHVPQDKDGRDLDHREYTANTSFTIIFRDFAKLGEMTSRLFRTPHVEISSTEWRLTPATLKSLGSELRKAAMRDAVQKAQDYADVLGRSPIAVEVTDQGTNRSGRTVQGTSRSRHSAAGSKAFVEGLVLEPEDVEWRSSIAVKFRAE